MDNNKIIIIVLIAVIAALLVGIFAMMPNTSKQDTNLTFMNNDTIDEGDSIKIKLTDANGTAIANQTVNVTVTDKNNTSDYHSVVTDGDGVGKLKLDKGSGKYNVTISYGGNDNFTGCNATQKLTVKEKEKTVEAEPVSSSSRDTYVERTEGNLVYGYKDGRYGFWTPSGNFIEDKSRALAGEDPIEPFMEDGDFYSQL